MEDVPNFRYLVQLLDEEVMRTDKRHRYGKWIRTAMRSIQMDNEWNCMRQTANLSIALNQTSAALPGNFKAFTPEKAPVHLVASAGVFIPCELHTFEHLASQYSFASSLVVQPGSVNHEYVPIYKSNSSPDGKPFLNIFLAAGAALTFRVSYFGFLQELVADLDTNYFLQNYTEMCESKLKAVAFASLNDPMAADFITLYEKQRDLAQIADARQTTSGRKLRMGG